MNAQELIEKANLLTKPNTDLSSTSYIKDGELMSPSVELNGLKLGPDPEMGFDPLDEDDTGLPCITFVSEGHRGCIPQIRIGFSSRAFIDKQDAIFSISNKPELLQSRIQLTNKLIKKVKEWIILNQEVLMADWNWEISTTEFIERIRKVNYE